jgi:prepilin-type N-terminal cleavage/methylation domain-containing protein
MKARLSLHRASGFTLLEIVIVVAIIALLAALMLSGGGPHRPTKRRSTEASLNAVTSALEVYLEKYGEYPEPANLDEASEVIPGKVYRIGAAKCLYQALSGDGNDAIKGVVGEAANSSNGTLDNEELKHIVFKDIPPTMRRKVGNSFILVDGYGRPFQYIKADPEKKNTVNSTYDLWSYGDDETNLRATSKDAEANPAVGAKWIKNW